jgi:glycosyltransferase involved in cell wall biosynthesis
MKIAIAGTRGIPNTYGGFEQCAGYLSQLLTERGHEVTVYNAHYHPYQEPFLGAVSIVHKYNPEQTIGAAGNFIYDYLCMRHAVRSKHDVLLVLGYTTASVFYPLMNFGSTALVTNMDGLEWKRDKWNGFVKKLARWFEKLGVRYSPWLVADNPNIAAYLEETYKKPSRFIPYGCDRFTKADESVPGQFGLEKGKYGMVIARMEPENNIEMAVRGFMDSDWTGKLVVVGNTSNAYGKKMMELASSDPRVLFTGGIYDQDKLSSLRSLSSFYIHGHSVGGTNPSLLEAMACGCFLVIHANRFNKAVVQGNAAEFESSGQLTSLLNSRVFESADRDKFREANFRLVDTVYSWEAVTRQYEELFREVLSLKGR